MSRSILLPRAMQFGALVVCLVCSLNSLSQGDDRASSWVHSILAEEGLSKNDHKARLSKYDFGPLWTQTENSAVFGIIGNDYQRLRIKFLSVKKMAGKPDTYRVSGKSMVRGVIRAFEGTITLTNARVWNRPRFGIDDEYRGRVKEGGVVVGRYSFREDPKQLSTGKFEGVFATYWYADRRGRLKYDDVESEADGYMNNQFVGTWTSYQTKLSKIANWGDYRIPLAGDLDIGAGEFSPDEKYSAFGWQSYRDAYFMNDKKARAEEEKHWWK